MAKEDERDARTREISRRAIIGGALVIGGGFLLYRLIGEEEPSSRSGAVNVTTRPAEDKSSRLAEKALVKAPDFEAQTVTGETVRLSDFKGQTVLLSFWQDSFLKGGPEFIAQEVQRDFPEIKQLSVAIGGKADVKRKLENFKNVNFPVLLNDLAHHGNDSISLRYGIVGIPTYIIVNSDGKIVGSVKGFNDDTREEIGALLQKASTQK